MKFKQSELQAILEAIELAEDYVAVMRAAGSNDIGRLQATVDKATAVADRIYRYYS